MSALPYPTPTITAALSALRQDLFDQTGADPRWQDTDLLRAIDRALDRLSQVSPSIRTVLVPAPPAGRLLAVPTASGPSWWIEAVEYPSGCYPRATVPFQELVQPALGTPAAPAVIAASGGTITGQYLYRVTYAGIAGETAPSPPSAPVAGIGTGVQVLVPAGPAPYTRARRLYRTPANGAAGTAVLLAELAGNAGLTYLDTAPDTALLGAASPPITDGTEGAALIELGLPDTALPDPVNPGTALVTTGGKHLWTADGTSLPEAHQEIVLLGAAAYACLAYTVPTNDLFDYQDGELRDHVSEARTPEHWQAMGRQLLALFEARLTDTRRQRDAACADIAQWGSVSTRWQWT